MTPSTPTTPPTGVPSSGLPSEAESDRFFTDVPPGRSPAPEPPVRLPGGSGPRGAWRRWRARWFPPLSAPGPLRAFTGPSAVTGPRTVVRIAPAGTIAPPRRWRRPWVMVAAVVLAALAVLADPPARDDTADPPPDLRWVAGSTAVAVGTCILGIPVFTDERVATSPGCLVPEGSGLLVERTLVLDEGPYPDHVGQIAFDACLARAGRQAPAGALSVVVPSPASWDAGDRTVVCARLL